MNLKSEDKLSIKAEGRIRSFIFHALFLRKFLEDVFHQKSEYKNVYDQTHGGQ